MDVRVEIELMVPPAEGDLEDMYTAAKRLTNNEKSVFLYVADEGKNAAVAEFTIDKARPIDVVDHIARGFRILVRNYGQSTISFPKDPAKKALGPREPYTPKQGQYLAFIYYYTKLHGCPPAEADMQRYFRTTAPAVHGMVMQLEKKGFISKQPFQPRSIRLLLTREELPELE